MMKNTFPHNPNVLYICQNAIGDIVTTLPSIHFLRRTYPDARLDICVNADYADIFAADSNVSSVISAPKEWFDLETDNADVLIKRLPGFQTKYTVVVDSMCSKYTAEMIKLFQPEVAVGIGFNETVQTYNLPLCLEHWRTWESSGRTATDCFGDLVRLFESSYLPTEPVLYVTDTAKEQGNAWLEHRRRTIHPVVALNPGAGSPLKRWPMQRFMELALRLINENLQPLFIFGPKEENLFHEYAERIEAIGGLIFRSCSSEVQPLAGILCQCSLLITNDCAVMHVGAAIGCRVLAIFGPSESRIWFPYSKTHNCVLQRDVKCRLSSHDGCNNRPCLTEITTEEVFSTAQNVLAEN